MIFRYQNCQTKSKPSWTSPRKNFVICLMTGKLRTNSLTFPQRYGISLREKGFFSMAIPKEYGGLGFSPLAISFVLTKIASRNTTAASTIGVPNSLGPAELLLHYGTEEQKNKWATRACKRQGNSLFCINVNPGRIRCHSDHRPRSRL